MSRTSLVSASSLLPRQIEPRPGWRHSRRHTSFAAAQLSPIGPLLLNEIGAASASMSSFHHRFSPQTIAAEVVIAVVAIPRRRWSRDGLVDQDPPHKPAMTLRPSPLARRRMSLVRAARHAATWPRGPSVCGLCGRQPAPHSALAAVLEPPRDIALPDQPLVGLLLKSRAPAGRGILPDCSGCGSPIDAVSRCSQVSSASMSIASKFRPRAEQPLELIALGLVQRAAAGACHGARKPRCLDRRQPGLEPAFLHGRASRFSRSSTAIRSSRLDFSSNRPTKSRMPASLLQSTVAKVPARPAL